MKFLIKSVECVWNLPLKVFSLFTRKEPGVLCVYRPNDQPKPQIYYSKFFPSTLSRYGLLYTFKNTWPWGKCYGSYGHGSRTYSQTEIYLGETPRTEMKEGLKKQRKIANPQIPMSNDDLVSAPFSAWFTKRYQDTLKHHSIIVSLPIQHLCCFDFFFFTFLTNKQRSNQSRVEVMYQIFIGVIDICEARRVIVGGPTVLTDIPLIGVFLARSYRIIHLLHRECVVRVRSTWRCKSHENIWIVSENNLFITLKSGGT